MAEAEEWFVRQVRTFVAESLADSEFYAIPETPTRRHADWLLFLKHVIEDLDGYRIFWRDGQAVQREQDLQLLFKLTWYATPSDVNSEVNNGRGPVDFKVFARQRR